MDPATQAVFLESPLYIDLKTAFQHIMEEKIKDAHKIQQNEDLEPYYYIIGLPLPFRGGCWCISSEDEQCLDRESCPCKPRPFMGVNMRLAVCNRDHDEQGNCVRRYDARRDCFDPRNVAEPYFLNILSRRSQPQTPWSQDWKERLTTIFGRYRILHRMYGRFVNAVCAVVDDMVDPFKAANAGWVPQAHGILGWYGQSAEYCIEELARCVRNAWRDRHILENPVLERGRRNREIREAWGLE